MMLKTFPLPSTPISEEKVSAFAAAKTTKLSRENTIFSGEKYLQNTSIQAGKELHTTCFHVLAPPDS